MPSGERANDDQGDEDEARTSRNRDSDIRRISALVAAGIQSGDPIVVGLTGLNSVVSVGRGSHRSRSQLGGRASRLRAAVHVVANDARAGLSPREADKVRLST